MQHVSHSLYPFSKLLKWDCVLKELDYKFYFALIKLEEQILSVDHRNLYVTVLGSILETLWKTVCAWNNLST